MLVVHPDDAPGQSAVHLSACWTPFPFESHQHLVLPVAPRILAAAAAAAAVVVRQNLPLVSAQSCQRVQQVGPEYSQNYHHQRIVLEHSAPNHKMDILNLQGQRGRQSHPWALEPTQSYPWALEPTQSWDLVRPVQELVPNRTKSYRHLQYSVQRQKDQSPCWSVQTVKWGQEPPLNLTQSEMMAVMQMEEPLAPDRKLQSQRRVLKLLELGYLQN
jgi:hypothetical protein